MESLEEQKEIEAALRRQAEPTHPERSTELVPTYEFIAGGLVKATIHFYRSPDSPDEPDVRLAA